MTSTLQKSECCSATSAAQHSENCSATSVFACGMLQGWGLEGWGLGLADRFSSGPRGTYCVGVRKGSSSFAFDLWLRYPSRTPGIASDFKDNAKWCCIEILGFRAGKSLAICDSELRFPSPKPIISAGNLAIWLRHSRKSLATAIARFWCAKKCDIIIIAIFWQMKNRTDSLGPTSVLPPPRKALWFSLWGKIAGDWDSSRKIASPLRFGWRRGRLRLKIAAICDCDFWCSQSEGRSRLAIPPVSQSQNQPRVKKSKRSLRESPRESVGVTADPPKRVKNESLGDSSSQRSPVFCSETHFWLFLEGPPGPPETPSETPPETPFWLFDPGPVLTPLADRRDRNSRHLLETSLLRLCSGGPPRSPKTRKNSK